MNVWLKYICF